MWSVRGGQTDGRTVERVVEWAVGRSVGRTVRRTVGRTVGRTVKHYVGLFFCFAYVRCVLCLCCFELCVCQPVREQTLAHIEMQLSL